MIRQWNAAQQAILKRDSGAYRCCRAGCRVSCRAVKLTRAANSHRRGGRDCGKDDGALLAWRSAAVARLASLTTALQCGAMLQGAVAEKKTHLKEHKAQLAATEEKLRQVSGAAMHAAAAMR